MSNERGNANFHEGEQSKSRHIWQAGPPQARGAAAPSLHAARKKNKKVEKKGGAGLTAAIRNITMNIHALLFVGLILLVTASLSSLSGFQKA